MKTKGCGVQERRDRNNVAFWSPTHCYLLNLFAGKLLSLSVVYAEKRACIAAQMLEMCGQGVEGLEKGVGSVVGSVGGFGTCP